MNDALDFNIFFFTKNKVFSCSFFKALFKANINSIKENANQKHIETFADNILTRLVFFFKLIILFSFVSLGPITSRVVETKK